jgi:hypothetical protein
MTRRKNHDPMNFRELVASVGSAPDNDGVLVSSSAAAFIGPAGVTTTTGFPIAANTPVLVSTTGSEPLSLYAVVAPAQRRPFR